MLGVSVAIPWLVACALTGQAYDFSPYYLDDPTLEAAYRAYKDDQWSAAELHLREFLEAHPDGDASNASRYLLTRVLAKRIRKVKSKDKRASMGRERLALLMTLSEYTPLAGPVHYELGTYYEAEGDMVSAVGHYRKVPHGGSAFVDARLAAARLVLDQKKNPKDALALLEPLSKVARGQPMPAVTLLEARAMAQAGKKTAALLRLRTLWLDEFGNRTSRQAAKALKALGKAPTATELVVLGMSHVRSRRKRVLAKKLKGLRKAHRRAAKSAFDLGRGVILSASKKTRKRALAPLKRAAKAKNAFVRGHALMRLARLQRRLDAPKQALKTYLALGEKMPDHHLAPRALVRASKLADKLDQPAKSRALLELLVKRYPDHPERVNYYWQAAWRTFKAGEFRAAGKLFDRLAKEEGARKHLGQATWGERALYWRGRCEMASGDKQRAMSTWAYVVQRFPLTYYSHQSYNRLVAHDPKRARGLRPHRELPEYDASSLVDLSKLGIAPATELDAAVELTRMGLYDEARKDLAIRARQSLLGPDGMTFLMSLGLRKHRYKESHRVVRWRGTLPRYPDRADQRLWKMAYPLPYWDHVTQYSREHSVSPWLLISLIRHESAYEPDVVSRSGAVGLTQLLVGTAKSVGKKLLSMNVRGINRKRLKQPQPNIRIGSRFLGELLVHFRGNEALALAAYNAGAGRARGWLRGYVRAGELETDVFVEEIPFTETHSYVKSILASYGAYQYLYGDRDDDTNRSIPLETTLPTELGPYFGRDSIRITAR